MRSESSAGWADELWLCASVCAVAQGVWCCRVAASPGARPSRAPCGRSRLPALHRMRPTCTTWCERRVHAQRHASAATNDVLWPRHVHSMQVHAVAAVWAAVAAVMRGQRLSFSAGPQPCKSPLLLFCPTHSHVLHVRNECGVVKQPEMPALALYENSVQFLQHDIIVCRRNYHRVAVSCVFSSNIRNAAFFKNLFTPHDSFLSANAAACKTLATAVACARKTEREKSCLCAQENRLDERSWLFFAVLCALASSSCTLRARTRCGAVSDAASSVRNVRQEFAAN